MVKSADMAAQHTPKSVSGGDSIFLPRIMRDYPQFNADLAKSIVEDNIREKYGAEHFADLKVHRTAISYYKNKYGSSTIKFQTAFQYAADMGKKGRRILQQKAETKYTFRVRDKDGGTNAALRCGHCGAPVARLGDKSCGYCGSEVILDLVQAWEITGINIIN
jgi:VCBS repeat-containing protein